MVNVGAFLELSSRWPYPKAIQKQARAEVKDPSPKKSLGEFLSNPIGEGMAALAPKLPGEVKDAAQGIAESLQGPAGVALEKLATTPLRGVAALTGTPLATPTQYQAPPAQEVVLVELAEK